MSDLLKKLAGARSQPPQDGLLCNLADDTSTDVFNVLSSETARRIYLYLQDESATASEIAAHVDTSIQNAQHHLANLKKAELVEVVDTEYSSKGSEMNIYAATNDPLIIVSGSDSRLGKVRSRLSDLLGGLALLFGGSVVVEWLAKEELLKISSVLEATTGLTSYQPAEPDPLLWLPPGLIFFTGGLMFLLGTLLWRVFQPEQP